MGEAMASIESTPVGREPEPNLSLFAVWYARFRGKQVLVTHDGAPVASGTLLGADDESILVQDGDAQVIVHRGPGLALTGFRSGEPGR